MKKLFLVVFVVIFGFSGCAYNQAMPQQPKAEAEPTLVQIPSTSADPKIVKAVETDPKSHIVEDTTLKPEGCAEVEVNYNLTLAEIARVYDWTTLLLLDRKGFRAKPRAVGTITKKVCWFKFDPGTLVEVALERIEASGKFLVADLWELNALGTAKPELQRGFPIVALGSEWHSQGGPVFVPCLFGSGGERRLGLSWDAPDGGWGGRRRFLAVSK